MCIIYFGTLVLLYISICIATIPTSTLMTSQGSDTVTFLNVIVLIRSKVYACWKWPSFRRHLKYSSQFHGIRVFECRLYTAGCGNKMAVSVTGPRAVNELGGLVIPGIRPHENLLIRYNLSNESSENVISYLVNCIQNMPCADTFVLNC